MDISLKDLRNQIDTLDREIVLCLVSQTGEKTLGDMIDARLEIAREIGTYKRIHQLPILDIERRNQMITSRVSWAPESHQRLVQQFFEVLHDISITLQSEGKNLL